MKEVPKKDRPDVAGGVMSEVPDVPCFPQKWPPPEDPITPERSVPPGESPVP